MALEFGSQDEIFGSDLRRYSLLSVMELLLLILSYNVYRNNPRILRKIEIIANHSQINNDDFGIIIKVKYKNFNNYLLN